MSSVDLSGRPIAITGASSGIGAATALACAKAGMPVAICARRGDKLAALADRLAREAPGIKVVTMTLDVADAAACEAFVRRAADELGGLYSVYANAGYGIEGPVHRTPDEQVRAIFETNFFGTLNVIRPALRIMSTNSYAPFKGHVLICSSCLAKMTVPLSGVYSATKAAQAHIGRAMRLELEPQGISVSTVHPIGTRTEFFHVTHSVGGTDPGSTIRHTPDWFMQDASFVAERTIACLRRPRPEVWTGFKGFITRLGMSVNTLLPRVADATTRGILKQYPEQSVGEVKKT